MILLLFKWRVSRNYVNNLFWSGTADLQVSFILVLYKVLVIPCKDSFNSGITFEIAHIGYRDQASKINDTLLVQP